MPTIRIANEDLERLLWPGEQRRVKIKDARYDQVDRCIMLTVSGEGLPEAEILRPINSTIRQTRFNAGEAVTLYRRCFQHLYGLERRRIPPMPAGDLRLHRLERPEPWPAELMEAIWAAQQSINFYPDYAAFYERLSEFVERPKKQIVVGAGIEDFIRTLFLLCCEPGDTVAYTWPTCAMFDVYAEVFGVRTALIVAEPHVEFTVDLLLEQLPFNTQLLILPNPGQPVDTCFDPDAMRRIAARCRKQGTVLAIDEAYYGFGAPTSLPLIDEFENVVVLRTFSKAFGGAGLRVGFAMGQDSMIRPLNAIRTSWEIAGPSLLAATVLMDHWDSYVVPGIHEICEGRDWLRDRLAADGHGVRGEWANHVLIEVDGATDVAARLRQRGVHVKAHYPRPLDRHLLVTCGGVEMMRRFHAEFREAVL